MITKCTKCGADVNSDETIDIIEGAIGDAIQTIRRECPNDDLAKEVIGQMERLRTSVMSKEDVKLSLSQLMMIQRALRAGRYGKAKLNDTPFVEGLES